jgi:N-acetylglucosamine kinase-like BadF-type ATPase
MKVFLGVDGGGTKTQAVLVRQDGRILGEGQAGPSNYHYVGLAKAVANIRDATHAAWKASRHKQTSVAGAFLGCAGIKSSQDMTRLVSAAESAGLAPAGDIQVANDLHNALAGGLLGRPGIALIAGTGTNCLGRDRSGQSFMCGGWGWLLDDVGGGLGLAMAAMRACVRSADGRGPKTPLLPSLLAFLGLSEPDELLARLYVEKWSHEELASFARIVMRHASEGDKTAIRVLRQGASALAELVVGVTKHLNFLKGPEVVLLGGCARSGAPYQPLVEEEILKACPSAKLRTPEGSTAVGAAINALRLGNISPLPKLQPTH